MTLRSAKHLSKFQIEKFTFLFNTFFDIKKNGLIEHNDIESFTEKLRSYSGWSKDSKEYLELVDVNSTFYECLRDQVKAEFQATDTSDAEAMLPWKDAFEKYSDKKLPKSMTLNQWLNMWGRLCYGSAGIANFLLGKDIYGPGKYIFGVFDNREIDETFPVRYNDEDEEYRYANKPMIETLFHRL